MNTGSTKADGCVRGNGGCVCVSLTLAASQDIIMKEIQKVGNKWKIYQDKIATGENVDSKLDKRLTILAQDKIGVANKKV